MSKSLSDEQVSTLKQWAEEGLDLNAIQKALAEHMGIQITYMETRFLLLDHGIELKAAAAPVQPADKSPAPAAASVPGRLKVTVDEVKQPGVYLSGQVSFPAGARATWLIDANGSVSWEPILGEPTQDDLTAFQKELSHIIRSQLGQI